MSYTLYIVSPAFNMVKMAWVLGVGDALVERVQVRDDPLPGGRAVLDGDAAHHVQQHGQGPPRLRSELISS